MAASSSRDIRCEAADLRALATKYERMLELRRLHARAQEDSSFVEPDPRRELARLAEEFPGALREIDRLPIETVAARLATLARAADDPAAVEPWMIAQVVFHRFARGALTAKRWLAGTKAVTAVTQAAFRETLPSLGDAHLFEDDLALVAAPPGGRLMHLVLERAAARLDMSPSAMRTLVLDPPRERRTA